MPADALHRVHARHARRRCAIRAAAGPGVRDRRRDDGAAGRQGRDAPRRRRGATSRIAILAFGTHAAAGARGRRGARRDGRQHALRQAARRRARRSSSRATTTRSSRSRRTWSRAAPAARWPRRSRRRTSTVPMLHLGLARRFIDHGDPALLLAHVGLDAHGHRGVDRSALRRRQARSRAVKPRRVTGLDHRIRLQSTAMNRPEQPAHLMPDPRRAVAVATSAELAIDQVGIRGLRYPLAFADADGVAQPHDRHVQRLRRAAGGSQGHAHVAARRRCSRSARRRRAPLSVASFARAAATTSSCASMRPAAASSSRSRSSCARRRRCRASRACSTTKCSSSASSTTAAIRRPSTVAVPVTSLCPCSKEISDYGAHNQRSTVTHRRAHRGRRVRRRAAAHRRGRSLLPSSTAS